MSLLYKQLTTEAKAKLASSIPPPAPFRADTLVVVEPGATNDWHDIAQWRELSRHRLALTG